jgi:hypothetical protein
MNAMLLTMILMSPIVSKNPVEQDTLATFNIHIAAGLRTANDIVKSAPEFGAKIEYLLVHPLVLRTSVDHSYSSVKNSRYPLGDRRSFDIAAEAFIYRGRKKLTAYLGVGAVYSVNSFKAEGNYIDTIFTVTDTIVRSISRIEIEDKYGYRFMLGIRIQEKYNFELGYQEIRPNFLLYSPQDNDRYNIFYRPSKLSTLRITLGYIFSP